MFRMRIDYEKEPPRTQYYGVVCLGLPEVRADLTAEDAVELVCCLEESAFSVPTRLVPTGTPGVGVVEDPEGVVALGFESSLQCRKCGRDLNWEEESFNWKTPDEYRRSLEEAAAEMAADLAEAATK